MERLHRILVATDFSRAGGLAVARAAELAREHDAVLRVVHATPDWNVFSRWSSAQKHHFDQIALHAQAALNNEVKRVHSTFGVHTEGELHVGKASEVIVRAIGSFEPTLVVAGARGEHEPRIAPAALGGTAIKLLFRTEKPLLLVRGNDAVPYKTSMAAVNGPTELSRRVVGWASGLVPNGDCHIVLGYDTPYSERMRFCGIDPLIIKDCVASAEATARESLETLVGEAAKDSHTHLHLEKGSPLGILVTEMATFYPQVVVVGRHETEPGQSPAEAFGSLGFRMAYHIPVDVLVVP